MNNSVCLDASSEKKIRDLYDRQVSALNIDVKDFYADTRFGKTHLLKTGNPKGKPILLFHGGNSTTPFNLRDFLFFRNNYLIYAIDTMGHPGKSAHTLLSPKNLEYGEWASDVINSLGFKKIICMGGSSGGGILMKLMCVAPHKISKAVLLVPSGICNASTTGKLFNVGFPLMMYRITQKEKWLRKAILPMVIDENEIDDCTLEMIKCIFDHGIINSDMPGNVIITDMKNYMPSTLLIAGEKDVLFPGRKLIARAKTIIPDLRTHLMKGSGHMCYLSSGKNRKVVELIAEFLADKADLKSSTDRQIYSSQL